MPTTGARASFMRDIQGARSTRQRSERRHPRSACSVRGAMHLFNYRVCLHILSGARAVVTPLATDAQR